jgi:hypothetical protein
MFDKEKAIGRMKKYLENNPISQDTISAFEGIDDLATCKKCSRVIYCGVNKLCSDIDCGLKNGSKERQS